MSLGCVPITQGLNTSKVHFSFTQSPRFRVAGRFPRASDPYLIIQNSRLLWSFFPFSPQYEKHKYSTIIMAREESMENLTPAIKSFYIEMAQATSLILLDKSSGVTLSNFKEACEQKQRIRDFGELSYVYRLFYSLP